MRLFVAVTPPPEIRDLLARARTEIERATWVKPGQLHVTLRFLGDVGEEEVAFLRERLRSISATRMSLRIRGVGTFGRPARVLWCAIEPKEEIAALAAAVDRAVVEVGLPEADKPFAAHMTLARLKNSPPVMVRRFLEKNDELESPEFSVDEFTLFESKLNQNGAVHSALESFPLGARS